VATEARRQFLRIIPNYLRLGATLLIGIFLTRLQMAWLGSDGFGLVALLGAAMGIGAIFQDLTRQSLIRELAAAHQDGGDAFLKAYNSSYVICLGSAVIAALAFGGLMLLTPLLEIPPDLASPARWLIAGEGVALLTMILLAPALNMYVVAERFMAHNLFTTIRRANYLIAAALLFYALGFRDPIQGVKLYGVVPGALNTVLVLVFVGAYLIKDHRLIPRPRFVSMTVLRDVIGTFGWNSAVIVAVNLHERVAAFIMNLAFGLWGNTVFGLSLRLTSYVRMATMGMTFGVDAVSARIAAEGDHDRMARLVQHSTRLHALVAIPSAVAVFVLAEPALTLWVGRYLDDPNAYIPFAVTLVRIMMLGLTARAISDGWMRILYGAGYVKRYAPMVLLGGVSNPVIAITLLAVLPDSIRYTAVGWGYTIVFVTVHLIALPILGARCTGLRRRDFVRPILRPAIAAIVASPALFLVSFGDHSDWRLLWLAGAALAYASAVGLLTAAFVLTDAERRRLLRAIGFGRPQDAQHAG
jgi:O-antigen/teichoic acid export membrane protein